MANTTGLMIAGVFDAVRRRRLPDGREAGETPFSASRSASVSRSVPVFSTGGSLFAACLLAACLFAHPASAAKPGGKSRYRSVSHGQNRSGTTEGGEKAGGDRKGLLGLGNLLSRGDRQNAREQELLNALPMERLTPQARQKLSAVTDKPTLYRRLPVQAIQCDTDLFLFLTRKPESIIGIWDLMGITKVQAKRTGPYTMKCIDGSGTTCDIDLIYGDKNMHVFIADGMYDGKFTQKPIRGKGVFVLKSTYARSATGATTVTGTLDCYIKFESLGADFLARSLGGLIGKSADHNFVETAKFISQISQACERNPDGMLEMVDQMPQVDDQTKRELANVVLNVYRRHLVQSRAKTRLAQESKAPVTESR